MAKDLVSALVKAGVESKAGITFIHSATASETVSYHEICQKALNALGALQQRGCRAGDEVVIQVEDNKSFIYILWACMMGGMIPVPLSCGKQEHFVKLFSVWKYLSHAYWVCDASQFSRWTGFESMAEYQQQYEQISLSYIPADELLQHLNAGSITDIDEQQTAYIQFSSGSTGEPKGVCLSHGNLITNINDIISSIQIDETDTLLSWMPLTHDMGLIGFHFTGVVMGIPAVCIANPLFIRRPLVWMDKVAEHKASILYAPNFGLQYFLAALEANRVYPWDLHCVKTIINGAEAISTSLCRQFLLTMEPYGLHNKAIVTAYGLAEASVEVSAMPVGSEIRAYYLDRKSLNIGNQVIEVEESSAGVGFADVGYPVSGCSVRICDDKDSMLTENCMGHIQIRGKNVTKGYYNNDSATRQLFTEDNWLRTGDTGFMRDGRLIITGRAKNIIVINGQNYYPQDIEQVITGAGIAEPGRVVACGAMNYAAGSEEVLVFILNKLKWDNFVPLIRQVREVVLNQTGIYVHLVIPVKKIPKTTSGKVQHYRLLQLYQEGAFDEYISFAQLDQLNDPVEQMQDVHAIEKNLVATVNALLGRTDIDSHTELSDIGLNSLLVMQLANRLSALTGKFVPVSVVFQCRDLTTLAGYIITAGSNRSLPVITKTADAFYYELSLSQKRIWLEYQFNKNLVAYNIPLAWKITGAFSESDLKKSLSYLIKKYGILRTSFGFFENNPGQRVHDHHAMQLPFRFLDCSKHPDARETAAATCDTEVNTPFDLEKPGQLRVTLIRIQKDEYLLVFVIHHILIDGWSLRILMNELCQVYNASVAGTTPDDLPPAIQYKDYAAWQNNLLTDTVINNDRIYWQNELQNLGEPVDLFAKRKIVKNTNEAGVYHCTHVFTPEDMALLDNLVKKHATSRVNVLLALLNILLYRYTNCRDITVGFETAGRISTQLEDLVGYTLNTLCLRIRPEPGQTFSEVVNQVKTRTALALDHQLYPYEQMVEDRKLQGHLPGNPLFNVLVVYQHDRNDHNNLQFANCRQERQPVFVRDGFVNMLLEFEEAGESIKLNALYRKVLYTPEEIIRFTRHLTGLLHVVAENEYKEISRYDFLTNDEKQFFSPDENNNLPAQQVQLPVHGLFERCAEKNPDAIAVYCHNNVLTYGELNGRANFVADLLKSRCAIQPDDRIGLLADRSEQMIIALLAILKSGAAYVAIDAGFPISRCEQIVTDSGIKYLLTDKGNAEKLKHVFPVERLIVLDQFDAGHVTLNNPVVEQDIHHLAYVIYTSGSTGKPKGVMITHASLTAYVQQFINYFRITGQDIFIQQSSVSFDVMVEEIFPALCSLASVVIAPDGGKNIHELIKLIVHHQVSVLSTTPVVLKEINNHADHQLSTLRLVISGGDLLHRSDIDHILPVAGEVYNTYGPCEATVCASYKKLTSPDEAGLIGQPVAGHHIYILDENRQWAPYGSAGEIYIEGMLARGYLNLPELTAACFVENPFNSGSRLYKTGDAGRWTNDGGLEFLGRIDNQVKIRGIRIEPAEIVHAMLDCPGVKTAAVIPIEDNNGEKVLIAYLVGKDSYDEGALRLHLRKRLPEYMIPACFILVAEMPLTATGKIDYQVLHGGSSHKLLQRATRELLPPRNSTEEFLLSIWKEILNRNDISITDNFFDIGGHSLKASQVLNRIREKKGIDMNLSDIFTYATLEQLAEQVMHLEQTTYEILEI
jgi:amino acid adenylation domain-containing protein